MLDLVLPPEEMDHIMFRGHQALHDDLRRGWHVKSVMGVENQRRLATVLREAAPLHHPVLGQLVMEVDARLLEEMKRKHGRDCWRDPAFRKRMAQLNPELNIRSKGGKTTLMVNGLRESVHAPAP